MKIYADRPVTRTRQVVADVVLVVWVAVWWWLGRALHDLVDSLAAPGARAEDAGSDLARGLGNAGDRAADLPFVGEALRQPFDEARGAAEGLAAAGRQLQDAVHRIADVLGVVTVVIPVVLALLPWLLTRARWVRDASAAQRLARRTDGLQLLALRAVARARPHALARVPDGTVRRFLDGDAESARALARLELQDLGLALPERPTATPPGGW